MSLPNPARGKATNVHTLTDDQLAALTRAAVEAALRNASANIAALSILDRNGIPLHPRDVRDRAARIARTGADQ